MPHKTKRVRHKQFLVLNKQKELSLYLQKLVMVKLLNIVPFQIKYRVFFLHVFFYKNN